MNKESEAKLRQALASPLEGMFGQGVSILSLRFVQGSSKGYHYSATIQYSEKGKPTKKSITIYQTPKGMIGLVNGQPTREFQDYQRNQEELGQVMAAAFG